MAMSRLHNALLAVAMTAGGLLMGAPSAYATPGTVFEAENSFLWDTTAIEPAAEFRTISPTVLEWVETGDAGDATSFLRILDPANTTVNITSDVGTWTDIALVEHENNIIPVSSFAFTGAFLNSFTLNGATFDLTGTDTLNAGPQPFSFQETSNSTPCPPPNPLGSVCDDIFSVPNIDNITGSFLFTALGERWVLSVRLLAQPNAGTFFDDAGNIIYTAEDDISHLLVQAMINQVPEPGSLALLAIGLAGLPLVLGGRRTARKDSKSA